MGPKKGKDKKGGGDAGGGELDDKAIAKMWELTSQSLQLQLGEYLPFLKACSHFTSKFTSHSLSRILHMYS